MTGLSGVYWLKLLICQSVLDFWYHHFWNSNSSRDTYLTLQPHLFLMSVFRELTTFVMAFTTNLHNLALSKSIHRLLYPLRFIVLSLQPPTWTMQKSLLRGILLLAVYTLYSISFLGPFQICRETIVSCKKMERKVVYFPISSTTSHLYVFYQSESPSTFISHSLCLYCLTSSFCASVLSLRSAYSVFHSYARRVIGI